jgi:hypothetical protein
MGQRTVHDALARLGGQGSLAASCLWHIVGLGEGIREWSLEHAGLNRHAASGVLLAALGILEAHFSGQRPAA